jgi:hypothetical protein
MGKVGTLLAAMGEVWQHCAPTGTRVLENVLKIEEVLKVIIKAEGAVVSGEFYRTGRRYRRVDAKGDCEHKPAKRQRKEALVAESCHPALEAKYELLMDPPRAREQPVEFFFAKAIYSDCLCRKKICRFYAPRRTFHFILFLKETTD